MNFTPERVQELFKAALDLSDLAARREMLERECAGDPELLKRVESLICEQDVTGGFGAALLDSSTPSSGSSYLRAGYVIAGRYKLLEVLGEGGMGSVWSAEQSEPVRREVAVKLIKWGMDSKQVLARFDAERQALAMMDHPNIAKVLDGGLTREGHPFFVMELVHGSPLTTYCDEQRLNPEQRLELFVHVCQGVQHAHQKGIVHRDLIADESGHSNFPDTLQATHNLTRLLFNQKRYQEALDIAQLNLKARRRVLPPNHPSTWDSAKAVIDSLASLDRVADAERVLKDFISTTGPWPEEGQNEMSWWLARLLVKTKNYPAAIEALEQILNFRELRFPGQRQVIEVRSLLGEALTASGDYAQAELAFSTAIEELNAAQSSANPEVLDKIREATLLRLEALNRARQEARASDAPVSSGYRGTEP